MMKTHLSVLNHGRMACVCAPPSPHSTKRAGSASWTWQLTIAQTTPPASTGTSITPTALPERPIPSRGP